MDNDPDRATSKYVDPPVESLPAENPMATEGEVKTKTPAADSGALVATAEIAFELALQVLVNLADGSN